MIYNYIYEYNFHELISSKKSKDEKENKKFKSFVKTRVIWGTLLLLLGIVLIVGTIIAKYAFKSKEINLASEILLYILGIVIIFVGIDFFAGFILIIKAIKHQENKNIEKALKLYKFSQILSFNFASIKKINF
ncbi:hypothetical protein ACUZ9N_00575 [Mycoplasmopsis gallinarum]